MSKLSKKLLAEGLGTFILVFFGCGSAVFMGDQIGMLGISLAFGLSIVAVAYSLGAISGAHLNPAVSLGMVAAGRMPMHEAWGYIGAQVAGAVVASAVLWVIASGQPEYSIAADGLGQNGYGADYLGGYSVGAAFVFETVATFLFVTVILGATQAASPGALAGLAIGLTLAAIHMVGINITGVSVNPARSLGPALFVGGTALAELWLFVVAPVLGGLAAGALFAAGWTSADERPADMVKAQPDIA
ncbi:aquaporin [Rubellimicrobium arenae]|uniref:aquaporin n=1 Tax=Rubellimicrobium arenae TaxID=2817372 RepID=UPI001B316DCF|nr:aquaporin [Rubellimicrobium arenae]